MAEIENVAAAFQPKCMEGMREDRTVCSVLESMRDCDKSKSYGNLLGLIEQVQEYVNRMEGGLWKTKDTSRKTYELLKKKKIAEAMTELEHRWPNFADKSKAKSYDY